MIYGIITYCLCDMGAILLLVSHLLSGLCFIIKPTAEVPFVEDILKTNRALPATFTFLDRRHKPHLLEVSAAQQRQTEALSRDKKGPVKMHPSPFDENSDSGKGKYVQYDWFLALVQKESLSLYADRIA